MKKSEIVKIYRFYKNGMYTDDYDVVYSSGRRIKYFIEGEMINKHFEFMMNSKGETRYTVAGYKVDVFFK